MSRIEKFSIGTLVEVNERPNGDQYDYRVAENKGFTTYDTVMLRWTQSGTKRIWSFEIPGMIMELMFRYIGDPYPDYRVLVGDEYFIVPTRYLKPLLSGE